MRIYISMLLVVFHVYSVCIPCSAYARSKRDCQPDGESVVETSLSEKPGWINKPHSSDIAYEYFTGISTKNEKLENGKKLALKDAKNSLLDAIGELIQTSNKISETIDATDMMSKLGSLNAPTLVEMKPDEMYYEKVAIYSDCKPSYNHNVWVLLKVQKQDFVKAKEEAVAYLQKVQQEEKAKKAQPLLPDSNTSFASKADKNENIKASVAKESKASLYPKIDSFDTTSNTNKYRSTPSNTYKNTSSSTEKKALYKSKAFWVIVGIVAAGAASGVALATIGGGGDGGSSASASVNSAGAGTISVSAPTPQ